MSELPDPTPKRACAVCGGTGAIRQFTARGLPPESPTFSVLRCPDCGHGATDPALPDAEIGAWYPAAYYGKGNVRFNPLMEWLVRVFRRRRARVIARHALIGPALDVGCGRGLVLGFLRDRGFEPHGVELNQAAAWHARTRLGLDVHVGDLNGAPYEEGQFRAIVFWHSLEHIRDFGAGLRRAHQLLAPGGLLVVAVPNSDSLQARLFRSHWFHLDVPRHYGHFGTRSLRRLLRRERFLVVKEDHFALEQNPYGWIQSFYNSLGLEFNFLYSILKSESARTVALRRHPGQALVTLALLPLVLPAALLLTLVEAAARRGGTIEVYAIKE